jgi:hypothetical protein
MIFLLFYATLRGKRCITCFNNIFDLYRIACHKKHKHLLRVIFTPNECCLMSSLRGFLDTQYIYCDSISKQKCETYVLKILSMHFTCFSPGITNKFVNYVEFFKFALSKL